MQFGIYQCGHWIVDPHRKLVTGTQGPCPKGHGQVLVIATPDDITVTFIPQPTKHENRP